MVKVMDERKQQIDFFFDQYRDRFNKALEEDISDIELTAELFSDCFIGVNPLGVNCGKNDEQFRDAMREGYAFYKNIGITSMEIISREITFLDDFHTMIKVRWKSNFIKKDGSKGGIEFEKYLFYPNKE